MDEQASADAQFERLYEETHRQVLAYAIRRTAALSDAEDAAADVYVVAWRRRRVIPSEPLPWLYAVARRVLANQRRMAGRRSGLGLRLLFARAPEAVQVQRMEGGPAIEALALLREDDRELLRLVAWEELNHAGIAATLGISPNAVAIRLHRARKRFADALARTRAEA